MSEAEERRRRSAAALRANLGRRKAQSRARDGDVPGEVTGEERGAGPVRARTDDGAADDENTMPARRPASETGTGS